MIVWGERERESKQEETAFRPSNVHFFPPSPRDVMHIISYISWNITERKKADALFWVLSRHPAQCKDSFETTLFRRIAVSCHSHSTYSNYMIVFLHCMSYFLQDILRGDALASPASLPSLLLLGWHRDQT